MDFTAAAIAQLLKGEVEGNPEAKVSNVAKIEEGTPGTLAFFANTKYEPYLYTTKSSIVLINKNFKLEKKVDATLIRVDDAYKAFASLLDIYYQAQQSKTGIEELSFVDQSAKIGDDVYIAGFAYVSDNAEIGNNVRIYPHVFIGDNVKIGDNTILYSGVKVYNNCVVANDCIIHAGAIIGADGFGFAPQEATAYKKVPQVGNVIIEENVEIGANTTVDRATMGSTIIRKGVKLDNLIQIAHNVEVDQNTVIAALTGISGSTKIGKNCMIAGQVGMVGHAYMADEVKVGAQSGIIASVKEKGSVLLGSPAWDAGDMKKSLVGLRKLPDLMKKISLLEKELDALKGK